MEKSIKWKDRFARLNVPIIFWGLLLLVVILGFVSPNSVKPAHLLDFTRQAAPMILVAIGQTIVMMIGGLDPVSYTHLKVQKHITYSITKKSGKAKPFPLFSSGGSGYWPIAS